MRVRGPAESLAGWPRFSRAPVLPLAAPTTLRVLYLQYHDITGAVFPIFGITMALTVGLETLCVVICSLMLVSVIKTGVCYCVGHHAHAPMTQ